MVAADERSYLNWSMRGEDSLALAAAILPFDRNEAIAKAESAVSEFREASRLYPSSVALMAQASGRLCLVGMNHPEPEVANKIRA